MLTSVLSVPTGFTSSQAACLVSSLVEDEGDGIAHDDLTVGGPVNANAGNEVHTPLKKYFLPDVLVTWPWPRRLNHNFPEVDAESSAWFMSFNAFSPKVQEAFNRCNLGKTRRDRPLRSDVLKVLSGKLVYLTYTTTSKGEPVIGVHQRATYREVYTIEHIRAGCDIMNVLFFIDEQTDVSGEHEVRKQVAIMTDAIHHPHKPRPEGEWIGGEIVRQ